MQIKKITSQNRRDFQAIYQCDHCDHEEKGSGYDDSYFHEIVIPNMKCPRCGEKASDSFRPVKPKYAADQVV